MKRLRYATPASHDISDILCYIARDNPSAADRLADRVERECQRIAADPDRGTHHDDLPRDLLVYRISSYLIIYQVEQSDVMILRVVHGARDLGSMFSEE
ncbi:MAG TPA: type II toxin-antitoxin system RelE/ParE family toxin [Planctomycetaceae bacterium]|nr:type II toxin-antitoxin system RelE/ParE family toxin [Planctomycetaceae bacterium]